jgi:hypothetical protein
MIVDCHAHLVPPDLLTASRKEKSRFPSARHVEDGIRRGHSRSRALSKAQADSINGGLATKLFRITWGLR